MASAGGPPRREISGIRNKIKRQQEFSKIKEQASIAKKKERERKRKEVEELGEDAPKRPKAVPKTQDSTREVDETIVAEDDQEVKEEEAFDEFASFFDGSVTPKIVITTNYQPSKMMFDFLRDLLHVFPNSFYYERKRFTMRQIIDAVKKEDYTDLIVINEDHHQFNWMTIVHLPDGPTAHFKLSSVVTSYDIPDHGRIQPEHKPELILNNFNTRLGHRVGRFFGALFNQQPNFKGRRVCTFHNQRDFIFFRQHRYIFESDKKARLQELGPRFTLKLQWLQKGTYSRDQAEFEWMHKPDMDTSRKRFFL